jgi:L-lactate dehydrogenase (cytochrome)
MPWNRDIRADMLRRAKVAGFRALVITVDVPVDSTRERQRRANLTLPMKITPNILWETATHPLWTMGTLREGIPSLKFLESYVERLGPRASTAHAGHTIYGQPSWKDVEEMQAMWDGPVMVKGVQKPQDARRLQEMGVDVVWVSNHSGRQFDGGPASIECLPAIRDAVPDMPLIYDSGIQGGLDVLRAVSLGADFVMLGRAWHYAVAALGRRGPKHLVDIMSLDMRLNMGQIGAQTLSDLAERLVARPLAPGSHAP